jgi:hypothetical protein
MVLRSVQMDRTNLAPLNMAAFSSGITQTKTIECFSKKKGIQGVLVEEGLFPGGPATPYGKVFVRGVSENLVHGNWTLTYLVPSDCIKKGAPWRNNIMDWDFRVNLVESTIDTSRLAMTAPDTSVLGRTITKLVEAFHTSLAPFMQPKIKSVPTRRMWTIQQLVTVIIRGIKDANIYDTLNRPDFNVNHILTAATHDINMDYPGDAGGVYLLYHVLGPDIPYWESNTEYGYLGKTVHFRNRYRDHMHATNRYGDLCRNSPTLVMHGLCIMEEADCRDFALLVEQIFVCLLQTYRADLLRPLSGPFPTKIPSATDPSNTTNKTIHPAKHAEAMHIAHYFSNVSEAIFSDTGFLGGVKRMSFGVRMGANYNSPYFEWSQMSEQLLCIRHDGYKKYKGIGQSVPMSVFRIARTKRAHFKKGSSADGHRHKIFCLTQEAFAPNIGYQDSVLDGTKCPREGAQYYVVFEVRTDGFAHPHHWSRLPDIGDFRNWEQAHSLAIRVEWEHPPNSGKWRYRYVQSGSVYLFYSNDEPGSHIAYQTAIGLIQWLFDTKIDNSAPDWMPRIGRTAYVLQTSYDYFKQSVEITPQKAYPMKDLMKDCRTRPLAAIIANYQQRGFLSVNGEFAKFPNPPNPDSAKNRRFCDLCVLLGPMIKNVYK